MKIYKPISIYRRTNGQLEYFCTTAQAKTCKEALKNFFAKYHIADDAKPNYRAFFNK